MKTVTQGQHIAVKTLENSVHDHRKLLKLKTTENEKHSIAQGVLCLHPCCSWPVNDRICDHCSISSQIEKLINNVNVTLPCSLS